MTQTPICRDISSKQEQDQHFVSLDIDWAQFKLIQAGFAKSKNVRLSYYREELEIIKNGRNHEFHKKIIGFLISLFA